MNPQPLTPGDHVRLAYTRRAWTGDRVGTVLALTTDGTRAAVEWPPLTPGATGSGGAYFHDIDALTRADTQPNHHTPQTRINAAITHLNRLLDAGDNEPWPHTCDTDPEDSRCPGCWSDDIDTAINLLTTP